MNGSVRITDVSPRDGLQNEPGVIATADKAELVRLLCATGVDEIEVTSFVSPKWVPQLGDAAELLALVASAKPRGACFSALVPNEKGLDGALAANDRAGLALLDKVSVFTAASETFNRKNINATFDESLARFEPVVRRARDEGLDVRGYLSCVIACPFEGAIDARVVGERARAIWELGIHEIDLGDTIGAGTPESVRAMLSAVMEELAEPVARERLTLHLHDTFGRAADCVREALRMGIRSFDGAVAGLGGCPYASTPAKRAPGNMASELLVATIRAQGYEAGVDEKALARAGDYARAIVARARLQGAGGPGAGR